MVILTLTAGFWPWRPPHFENGWLSMLWISMLKGKLCCGLKSHYFSASIPLPAFSVSFLESPQATCFALSCMMFSVNKELVCDYQRIQRVTIIVHARRLSLNDFPLLLLFAYKQGGVQTSLYRLVGVSSLLLFCSYKI